MKEKEVGRCHGCSRRCLLSKPCCKYGKKCAEKLLEKTQEREKKAAGGKQTGKKYKWKSCVEKGGLLMRLIKSGKAVKGALRKGNVTEQALLNRLTAEEQEVLLRILKKLDMEI